MLALVASAGVGGGAPPAIVEIVYCWADARPEARIARRTPPSKNALPKDTPTSLASSNRYGRYAWKPGVSPRLTPAPLIRFIQRPRVQRHVTVARCIIPNGT